jgi:serine protease Do
VAAFLFVLTAGVLALQPATPAASAQAESTSQPTTSRAAADRTSADGAFLERLQQASADLVDRVSPSVVCITAERVGGGPGKRDGFAEQTPPLDIAGAGVVIRADGMILTSQHVVESAGAIRVTLSDGRRVRAALVAADPRSDLAVLRIDAPGLIAAELGDAAGLRRGHLVFAFGQPLETPADVPVAVSLGIVSAVGCPLPESFGREEDRSYGEMIQTTAHVSPGDSGGPLVDIRGRVVGVITVLSRAAGDREGVGLAVPIDGGTRGIIARLLRGERIEYGYLGVRVGSSSEPRRAAAGLDARRGAVIEAVLEAGPAAGAGLAVGDLVVALDGVTIDSPDHLIRLIGAAGPGRKVEITFVRQNTRQTVRVELAPRRPAPEPPASPATFVFRGATLRAGDAAVPAGKNLPPHALLVLVVDEGSAADRAGLTPGDIITQIQGQPVAIGADAVLQAAPADVLLGLANGKSILVKGKSGG